MPAIAARNFAYVGCRRPNARTPVALRAGNVVGVAWPAR
jgi:hypothetical protein